VGSIEISVKYKYICIILCEEGAGVSNKKRSNRGGDKSVEVYSVEGRPGRLGPRKVMALWVR